MKNNNDKKEPGLRSFGPNSRRFWTVKNLRKLLKNQNFFWNSAVHVNEHPPIKFQYLLFGQSWDNSDSSAPILGWGLNSNRFRDFVPGCT